MNKKIKFTSLAAAALATIALSNANLNENVKAASTQDAKNVKETKSPIEQAQDDVKTAQANVDKADSDLKQAKSDAVEPNTEFNKQKDTSDALSKNAQDKNNALKQAEAKTDAAEKLVDEAKKPGAIDAAKKAVSDQNDVITKKNADLKATEGKTGAADQAINDANDELGKKNADLSSKLKDQEQAQKNLRDAEDALKGTGIDDTQREIDVYNQNIHNLNDTITHNQTVLKDNQNKLAQNQSNLSKVTKNLNDAKDNEKKTNSNWTEAKNKLNQMEKQLANDKVLANSAAGFFKSLAEDSSLTTNQREDAQTAYGIIMNDGKFQGMKLSWHKDGVHLGQAGDATSLDNMRAALNDLDELVKVRNDYKLRVPKVSLTAMAVAMMSADYLTCHEFDHPILHPENGPFFKDEEDIAENIEQVQAYMSEKDDYIDPLISSHPEYKKYDYNNATYDKWQKNNDFWQSQGLAVHGGGDNVIGHFTSMVNPLQDGIGMATTESNPNGIFSTTDILPDYTFREVFNHSEGKEKIYDLIPNGLKDTQSFTIDQYKQLVNKYVSGVRSGNISEQPNFIQIDQKNVNEASNNEKNAHELEKEASNNVSLLTKNKEDLDHAIQLFVTANANTTALINNQKAELEDQKQKLQDANKRLEKLTADNSTKTQNFKNAKAAKQAADKAVADTKSAVTAANNALTSAKNAKQQLLDTIERKQKDLANEQAKNTQLSNHLNDLQHASEYLVLAQKAQATAQNEFNAANKAANEAAAKLAELKTKKDAADAKVQKAQKALDDAKAKLAAAQTKLDALTYTSSSESDSQTKGKFISAPGTLEVVKEPADKVIPVYNGVNGQITGKTYKLGDSIKTLGYEEVNGTKWYKVSENEWIKDDPENIIFNTNEEPISKKVDEKKVPKTKSILLKLVHNSYVYNKHGKIVKRHGKRYLIKKGHHVAASNKAKIVKINGKRYYQIGKNEYVKASNVITPSTKIDEYGKIKGHKNQKIRTYSSNSKVTKHHVYGQKRYHFTAKKNIKGTKYYKLAGKNLWVKANRISF